MDRPEKYRTRFDKNTFHNKITCCEMSVFDYHGNIRPEKVLVDKADVPFIKAIKWRVGGNGYVGSSFGYLHNFLLQRDTTDRTIVVDHDNGNPLDCRRNNLKVVSQTYNLLKAKIRKDNTSGEKEYTYIKGTEELNLGGLMLILMVNE